MRKRYKYILCGVVNESDKLSDFRLIDPRKMWYSTTDVYGYTHRKLLGDSAIRVIIPDGVEIRKFSGYGIACSDITIGELGYEIVLYVDGKWVVFDKFSLNDYQPHEFFSVLEKEYGLHCSDEGYFTDEKYSEYVKRVADEISKRDEETNKYLKMISDKHDSFENYISEIRLDKSRLFLFEESLSIVYMWCDKFDINGPVEFMRLNNILLKYAS